MTYKGRAPFQSAAFTETQRNFTYFDKSLTTALTDVVIESPGDFLYIDQASTGVVRVELNMRQGGSLAPITLAAGGSIECDFSSVKITANAQINKSVRIVIGNGARIKGGANVNASSMSVSVVDGGKLRTAAGVAFTANVYVSAVAAQLAHVQLWNPSTTGKNLIVEKMYIASASACAMHVRSSTAALAAAYASAPTSKLFGGSASVALLKYTNNAAEQGVATLLSAYLKASDNFTPELREPLIVPPGYGVIVNSFAVNTDIGATFEYYEE
jgi:hypothetical protein